MTIEAPRVALPLLRGTLEGADCLSCPLSRDGGPGSFVLSEFPEDPAFLVIGEGPGQTEVRRQRPLIGPTGQVVEQILGKIRRTRDQVWMGNVTACLPPPGAPVPLREQAARACRGRLLAELAQFPGKPILSLGAVAARALIPQSIQDEIDPPDTPKAVKRAQKLRQEPARANAAARRKAISKITTRRLKKLIAHHRKALITTIKVKHKRRPDERYLDQEINRVHAKLLVKAQQDAIKEHDLKIVERAMKRERDKAKPRAKPKKKAPLKITDICGTLFDVDIDGTGTRPLIPAIHPASLLRGGGASIGGSHTPDMAFINLTYDAAKVDALGRGVDVRLRLNSEYEVQDPDRIAELFLDVYRRALDEGEIALDLETYVDDVERHHALMAYVARIRVIGLSTKDRTVALAWDLIPAWCMSLLQLLLGKITVVTHNGLYDRTVLRANGFVIPWAFEDDGTNARYDDTLYAHHAGFPGNAHKLQVVAAQFFGVPPWKSEYRNAEETPERLADYCASDTGATQAILAPLRKQLVRTKTEQVYQLDKQMADIASQMHLVGMPVDREINEDLLQTFSKSVREARGAVEEIATQPKLREEIWHHLALQQARKQRKLDPDDFEARYQIRLGAMQLDPAWKWKISAGKHIAALLLAMGVGLYQTTDGGDISTKKDVLESLADVPIVRQILGFREADKLLSTFVWPLFDRRDQYGAQICHGFADEESRIHPIWNVHRISGRWASQWPVVSNVPKDKWQKLLGEMMKIAAGAVLPDKGSLRLPDGTILRKNKDGSVSRLTRPNLRRQIRAPKGRIFVGFDFEQIEARVIALISGDAYLCDIFANEKDIHIENARVFFPGFDAIDGGSQKQLREQGKPITYGAMYLANVETLHKQMLKEGFNIKLADLAKAVGALMQKMAGVVRWQQTTVAQASIPPYVISDFVLGRRRTWPMGQVEATEACNFGVQTAAAGIMNTGMAKMARRLLAYREAYPIAQIHDACVFECWEDDAPKISADIVDSFTAEFARDGRVIKFPVSVKTGQDWASV